MVTMEYAVDIVVPVYNEPEYFEVLYQYLTTHVQSKWRIFLVYDFAEDTTLSVAQPIAEKDSRIILTLNPKRGALNAIKTGFTRAECDAVLVLPIDEQSVFEKIDELVRIFYEQHATIVVASRYMKGGKNVGSPPFKRMLSRLAGISLHWLIGIPIHDPTLNSRLYKKSFLDSIIIESTKGFEVALEITIKAYLAGGKLLEIPLHWVDDRAFGVSRFKLFKWLPSYFHWYWYGIKNYWLSKFSLKKS